MCHRSIQPKVLRMASTSLPKTAVAFAVSKPPVELFLVMAEGLTTHSYATREGAEVAGRAYKKKKPLLNVSLYDCVTRFTTPIE